MSGRASRIEVTTPSDREVVTKRAFDAPVKLVFDCHTKPELVQRWLTGPPGWTMPVCEIDLRVGGAFRYRWRKEDGSSEFGMVGTYREIAAPRRIVNTQQFDDGVMPEGGDALITTIFEEKAGRTTVTLTMLFPSKQDRDGAVGTGMTGGMEQSYQKLEKVLADTA
jgi:uncharacterized protein YndB with AHSA1/START domain